MCSASMTIVEARSWSEGKGFESATCGICLSRQRAVGSVWGDLHRVVNNNPNELRAPIAVAILHTIAGTSMDMWMKHTRSYSR